MNLLWRFTLLFISCAVVSAFQRPAAAMLGSSSRFTTIVPHHRSDKGTMGLRVLKAGRTGVEDGPVGLYRHFADHAWGKLKDTGWFVESETPEEFQSKQAPAKGIKDSTVKISIKAMVPSREEDSTTKGLVRYARVALLETVSTLSGSSSSSSSDASTTTQSAGIQVLNLVVIPSESTSLPVLGIDLVSLPGNRHLLLLDAQPMTHPNPYDDYWADWYTKYVQGNRNLPWGGDFPEAVQKYVSKYSLWTRLQELEDPVSVIETNVWDAFQAHFEIYLDLLAKSRPEEVQGPNHQAAYLDYRRSNDPARPMLNSLYGPEWTERVLDEVLFPKA